MATRELDELRKQLETLQNSHDTLLKSLAASNGSFGPSDVPRLRRNATQRGDAVFADTSTLSDDSSDDEDDFFVQAQLPAQSFDHEHLREHLKTHNWDEHGREVLASLVSDPSLLPLSDVGKNSDKPISGRITVAREPSPILFGALHLTMHHAFDMDELFRHLVKTEASSAHMFRAFEEDPRHQRTFFFTFEYYTIIGDDCKPMQWQRADTVTSSTDSHIPLSRCGAVVALALFDDNPRRVRNRARRSKTNYGWVSDPFTPWQVLQLECFPDWKSAPLNGNPYTFENGHKYLNGPEAFLHAVLTEYRDARKRYDEIYRQITELVTPPLGFLFDEDARRKRLFEDKHFTWTRRYFYAHQALGNVNDSIKAMIDAFEDTFTDDIWEGTSKTLWPLYEESPRNEHWKRRLRLLRLQFEREMKELRILQRENNERRHEIETLQEQLFSGTSIQESRKSVELADVTVHQGYNIKVLTIVNLFFMPLTFVTSIFGMTNMPAEPAPYWPFAITLAAICIPFFSIIGFLSTNYGYHVWATKTRQFWRWLRPKPDPEEEVETEYTETGSNFQDEACRGLHQAIRIFKPCPAEKMFAANTKPYILPTDGTWLITGCSSGIGKALAEHIASKLSYHLVATARNMQDLQYLPDDNVNILKLALDVTSPDAVSSAINQSVERFGSVDVLVNSAGYALSGDTESATEAESHEIMETNFFGTVRTTLAALPHMRKAGRGGLIMNISSVAGACAFPGHAFYHASKHAVEGWTESLAKEVSQDWGISFCIVEPAAVKTNFEGHSKKNTAPHPAYTDPGMPARMLQKYVDAGLKKGVGMEPEDVARALYEVGSKGDKVPLHLPLSMNAYGLISEAFKGRLEALEKVKDISGTLS
ncbi:hypothetical protein E8E13_009253 [Curvularia kusanoi]|uniref:Ketoreductase domain-containing protein n=1 Tax=Curvularia kusanoi TaxID=90978 RepID=A0A9P4WCF5_CURKU|nr:hypothetical protein E8E13_009253 [Curvularia kusanoi]